jgi:hypothetical protein
MIEIRAYCRGIELYPTDNRAYEHLNGILTNIGDFDYGFYVSNPNINQGQMVSDFDYRLKQAILSQGALSHILELPPDIPQQLDFSFRYDDSVVAVEVEKTNREKILRDILKAHIYLHAGADYALLVLPKNYPHSLGIWNLYEFGIQRFMECKFYGFGVEERLERILLLGYEQVDAETETPIDISWRKKIRRMAKEAQG